MYDEEKGRLLDRIGELTEQNNKLLHKLVRAQRWATFWSALWWLVVLGSSVVAYYYLQPYLDQILKLYKQLGPSLTNFTNLMAPH